MNIDARITNYVLSLPTELEPLRVHALKWIGSDDNFGSDGVVCIHRTPKVAPLAFRFRIYPGAMPQWLEAERNQYISAPYRQILTAMNGCFAYGLTLYGLAPSMQAERPLLDRMVLQPLDLYLANSSWKFEFKSTSAVSMFHFGGRHYSYTENVGYFQDNDGSIVSLRKNGNIVGKWPSFLPFLKEELAAAVVYEAEN